MSVTSVNPNSEEDEIHDLVLLFANSRFPRGSDAFQSILGDLKPPDEEEGLDEVDAGVFPKQPEVQQDKPKGDSQKRLISPKPTARGVHWPDEGRSKLTSSPRSDQLHHARIYVKTTPSKPILKHDDGIVVDSESNHT